MHEPFVRIVHLYVHIMHMLTNVHVIFSGLSNIESALTEKKNITRSIQRKIKYILLIISSIYFYIHRTLTFFLEISGGKYEIIQRKWNFHTLSFFSYLVFLLQASIHKTAGEQIWKSLKTFLCSFETGMTTFYFHLWCMM